MDNLILQSAIVTIIDVRFVVQGSTEAIEKLKIWIT